MKETASLPLDIRRLALAGSMLLIAAAALVSEPLRAQDRAELEELVGPVALYPDDVLGIVLPAAAFPLQIVQAARFLEDLENDPTLEPDPDWDDSIIALLNYPEILLMMNEDLDWTWALGEAVLNDQAAVLAAAQDFRRLAYAAGNLETDDRQTVIETDGAIVIRPTNPEVVYIPYYDPYEVVVYHSRPAYYYYPVAYPVYYYPYPVGYRFGTGFFFGVTSWFSIGWDSHFVHVHHHSHYRHPYYLHTYYHYTPYYYRRGVNITVNVNNYTNVWQAGPRRGSRPGTLTVSGGTSTVRTPSTATVETQPGAARTRQALTAQSGGTRLTTESTRRAATPTRPSTGTEPTADRARAANSRSGQGAAESRRAASGQAGQAGDRAAVLDRRAADSTPNAARTRTSPPEATRPVPSSGTSPSQLRAVPRTPAAPARPAPTRTLPNASSSTRSVAPTTRSPAPTTRSITPATRGPAAAPAARRAPATIGATRAPSGATRAPSTAAPVTRGPSAAPPARASSPATRSRSSSSSSRRQR